MSYQQHFWTSPVRRHAVLLSRLQRLLLCVRRGVWPGFLHFGRGRFDVTKTREPGRQKENTQNEGVDGEHRHAAFVCVCLRRAVTASGGSYNHGSFPSASTRRQTVELQIRSAPQMSSLSPSLSLCVGLSFISRIQRQWPPPLAPHFIVANRGEMNKIPVQSLGS